MTLHGTRALVTGGSRGIGLAYVEALAHAGCDVVINHLADSEKAQPEISRIAASSGTSIYEIDADISKSNVARDLVHSAANLLGGLDIVVSNAGICQFISFLELTDNDWDRHNAVNFNAGFYIGQEAARLMVKQGCGGRIVYTSSVGAVRSNGAQTHYCATKGGLSLLSYGMAIELAQYKITVNCIAPGWIHTDICDEASRDMSIVEPWLQNNCPVGRLGRPDDLKSALLYLCAADSSYVTGSTVTVDGGWNAKL